MHGLLLSCSAVDEPAVSEKKVKFIRGLWRRRLGGVQRNVEVGGTILCYFFSILQQLQNLSAFGMRSYLALAALPGYCVLAASLITTAEQGLWRTLRHAVYLQHT